MNKVNMFKGMMYSLMLTAAVGLSGCMNGNSENFVKKQTSITRLEKYMSDNNYSEKDIEARIKSYDGKILSRAKAQALLDSMAYRNLFNSTQAVNDSEAVEKYNAIASNMKFIANGDDKNIIFGNIMENARWEKISDEDSIRIERCKNAENIDAVELTQYAADRSVYTNLFKKLGILSDSIKNEINKLHRIISPKRDLGSSNKVDSKTDSEYFNW